MKHFKVLLLSFTPFIIGYSFDYALKAFDWYGMIVFIISILFSIYWFYIGYKSYDFIKISFQSILLGNCFAIFSILLIFLQILFIGRFLPNIIGIAPQMFYLPLLPLASKIENILLFFIPVHSMLATFTLSFLLMIIIYYAGYFTNIKKHQ